LVNLLGPLQRLAGRLLPYLKLVLVLVGFFVVWGLYAATTAEDLHAWDMRIALVLSIWFLNAYACVQLFHNLPPPVLPALRWHERLRARLRRLPYQLMALFMVLLTLLLLQMSLKLLTV